MKKNRLVIITIIMLLIGATTVLAVEPKATIEGESTVGVGKSQKVTVAIEADETIGVVSGSLKAEGDITIKSATGKNGWSIVYNNKTGAFNLIKAEGAKNDQIMEIEYTAANKEGTGNIKIEQVNVTTLEYDTKEIGNISKEIQIVNENTDQPDDEEDEEQDEKILEKIEIAKNPIKTTYIKGEKFDKKGMTIIAKYTDGSDKEVTDYTYNPSGALKTTDEKVTISYTENGVTKTVTIDITVKEETGTGGTSTGGGNSSGNGSTGGTSTGSGNSNGNGSTGGTSAGSGNSNGNGSSAGSGSADKTVSKNDISKAGLETIIVPIVIVGIFAIVGLVGYKKYNKV